MNEHAGVAPDSVEHPSIVAAVFHTQSGTEPEDIGAAFGKAFSKLDAFMKATDAQMSGPPRAIYTAFTPGETEFTVAIPLAARPPDGTPDAEVTVAEIQGGSALRFVHKGPYENLSETYDRITEWMKAEGLLETEADWESHGPVWEEYVNDPNATPAEELITHIYIPSTT